MMDDEDFVRKIRAGSEVTEHDLTRARSIVNDKMATWMRQPVAPNPAVLIAKMQLMLIEWDTFKTMVFGEGSQFQELHEIHALASLERFTQWLDEVTAEAQMQRLIVPPNRNGN